MIGRRGQNNESETIPKKQTLFMGTKIEIIHSVGMWIKSDSLYL